MTDQMTNEKPTAAPAPDPHPETRQGLLLPILIPLGSFAIIGVVLFGFSRVLLSITPHAATAVALIVAISVMIVAIVVASRQRLSNGALFSMVGSIAGIAMLAGGLAIVTIGAGEEEGAGPQVVTLAAPKGAAATGFDPTSLSVAANAPIELDFSNQDPGIQHNVVIFPEDPAKNPDAKEVFSGALVTGAADVKYDVPPLPPGTFFFHCVVHPTTMIGTIDSAEGGGGGGGGSGGGGTTTVMAKDLAFDTDQLNLTAGQPTTLTFDNEDAGVPHNIAIYSDDSLAETLFQGTQFPGIATEEYQIPALDAGTYYFHCDVHTTMSGTVVVGPAGGSGPAGEPPPDATGASGASG